VTRVAVLTPAGTGAIATIAVVGPGAWDVVRKFFRPASDEPLPDVPNPHRTWLGKLGEGAGDEVVVAVPRLEPEPWVEVHCHGGRQVVRWLVLQFVRAGCMEASWTELVPLTKGTDSRALEPLTRATTTRTASILLDQFHSIFSRRVAELLNATDPDLESGLAELVQYAGVGRHLVEPWRVVLAGPPNVGKSSLVNALAGYQRSIVTPVPGTTRDVVSVSIALDGWPVELLDTAGLRSSADDLEAAGIGRAERAAEEADLVLHVIDGADPASTPAPGATSTIAVVNKSDLAEARPDQPGLRVSALSGAGVPELAAAIVERLVPSAPLAGAAVPFTPHLAGLIVEAHLLVRIGTIPAARETLSRCLA
jgi:tRNA modification GTPase